MDNREVSPQPGRVDLDTALLRAFVETADAHHFGRAATRLFISQQALSKRIARLEASLGVRVFDRTSRRVELTAAGVRLLPFARDAVNALDAVTAAAGVGMEAGRTLRVDVMDEHAAAVGLLRRACDADPTLRLETSARGHRAAAAELLESGAVDVAFGRADAHPWPDHLRRRCALLEPLGLLVGRGHRFWSRDDVAMPELAGVPLRFPLVGAPSDWVGLLHDLTGAFGLTVDDEGCSLSFDHFLDHPAENPASASLYGLEMRAPAGGRLRVVPIVDPVPVFAWAVMWGRRTPDSVIDRLVGSAPGRVPTGVWLPAPDRAWLGGSGDGRAGR